MLVVPLRSPVGVRHSDLIHVRQQSLERERTWCQVCPRTSVAESASPLGQRAGRDESNTADTDG